MPQTLASLKSDGRPIDFGTATFPGGKLHFVRGSYRCQWDFVLADVDLTTVADNYKIPVAADPPTAAQVAETQARGMNTRKALVRAKAAALRRKGRHVEALSLLSSITGD